jgi:hypothetical protein
LLAEVVREAQVFQVASVAVVAEDTLLVQDFL